MQSESKVAFTKDNRDSSQGHWSQQTHSYLSTHWLWSTGELRKSQVNWYPQCGILLPKEMWLIGQQPPPQKETPIMTWCFLRELSDHLEFGWGITCRLTKTRNNCSPVKTPFPYFQFLPWVNPPIRPRLFPWQYYCRNHICLKQQVLYLLLKINWKKLHQDVGVWIDLMESIEQLSYNSYQEGKVHSRGQDRAFLCQHREVPIQTWEE